MMSKVISIAWLLLFGVIGLEAGKFTEEHVNVMNLGLSKSRSQTASIPDSNHQELPEVPVEFYAGQNYPNPFNSATIIEYRLPYEVTLFIGVYNVLGQNVKTLHKGGIHAGYHSITWDGRDNSGEYVASGIYFYVVAAQDWYSIRKMAYIK